MGETEAVQSALQEFQERRRAQASSPGQGPGTPKLAKELAFLRTVRRQSLLRLPTFEASEGQSVKQATEGVNKCELPSRTRISVYLSTNDKTDTVWGKYNAFFQNGTVRLRLVYQKNYAESMKLCPLPDEFYFSPTQDLKTMLKGRSRNLRNVLHPASKKKWMSSIPKCPIYSLSWKPHHLEQGESQMTSFVFGVELKDQDRLERLWSTAAIETLSRKFIADTATQKNFKVFTSLWKRYR